MFEECEDVAYKKLKNIRNLIKKNVKLLKDNKLCAVN